MISSFIDVSVYSLNLTTAMGLGLAIDYSLFIVSRYREELRNGLEPHDAVVRTVETAGRTVLGSALTVAVALGALLLFPLTFLRSFAYAGVAVSLLAAARCGDRPARAARRRSAGVSTRSACSATASRSRSARACGTASRCS